MGSFKSLSARMRKAAAKSRTLASDRAKEIGDRFLVRVVYDTPIDTSNARSNWQVSLDAPIADGAEIGPYYMGSYGSTAGPSSEAAIAAGRFTIGKKEAGQTLYLSNVVDYIGKLNEGFSRQARPRYVQNALFVAVRLPSNIKLFD